MIKNLLLKIKNFIVETFYDIYYDNGILGIILLPLTLLSGLCLLFLHLYRLPLLFLPFFSFIFYSTAAFQMLCSL